MYCMHHILFDDLTHKSLHIEISTTLVTASKQRMACHTQKAVKKKKKKKNKQKKKNKSSDE